MGALTVLLGGVRSGKSALAVEFGRRHHGPVVFVATSDPFDDDLRERVQRHRDDRPDWPTLEAPLDLAGACAAADPHALVVVDCLTVWLGNVLHHGREPDVLPVVDTLRRRPGSAIVVTNEVGMGVHPPTELGRRYADELGKINRIVVAAAERALLVVAGRVLALHCVDEVTG